jgi:hypothetical protein
LNNPGEFALVNVRLGAAAVPSERDRTPESVNPVIDGEVDHDAGDPPISTLPVVPVEPLAERVPVIARLAPLTVPDQLRRKTIPVVRFRIAMKSYP